MASLAAGASAQPDQPTPRATHAFTITASSVPWLLATGMEARVPLTIRNDGLETWNSDHGFRVAYHWLTLRGTMVSRDGARTELPAVVRPGRSVDLVARLFTPEEPGIYRLQWDMVQEHVTWFSVRDPHFPITHVMVVMPGMNGAFNAVPALTVIALCLLGFIYAARKAWTVHPLLLSLLGLSDLIWCTSSLWSKQWRVIAEAETIPSPGHGWIALAVAAVGPVMLLWLPRRFRPWAAWVVAALGALLVLADLLYFRYFGDVISAPAVLGAGQTGRLGSDIRSLLQGVDIWLAVDLVAAIPLLVVVSRMPATALPARWSRRVAVACALIALVPGTVLGVRLRVTDRGAFQRVFRNMNLVEDIGLFGYHAVDLGRQVQSAIVRADLGDDEVAEVQRWFVEQALKRSGHGEWFGVAKGRNLIVLQVESMQQFVLRYEIGGQRVMPELNNRLSKAIWFSRMTDQTSEGRTSDGEFVTLASLLPIQHGAVAFRYPANRFVTLPDVLAKHGYHTLSAIPFDSDFWNRRVMHPAYGFARSLFVEDFRPGERIGWGLNDRDFLKQLAPTIQALPRPFAVWGITLSLHHPFTDFPDHLKSLDVGPWEGEPFGNYLHTMHFFDQALAEFIGTLGSSGLLDNTVIVVMGDHDAGFRWNSQLANALGFSNNQLEWTLADRVPFVVWIPGEEGPRGENTTLAGQSDITPTLLSLLGIDAAPFPFVGRNLMNGSATGPVIRPYGNWLDEHHLFIGTGRNDICYDTATRQRVGLSACQPAVPSAAEAYRVSQQVVTFDLQERLADEGVQ